MKQNSEKKQRTHQKKQLGAALVVHNEKKIRM